MTRKTHNKRDPEQIEKFYQERLEREQHLDSPHNPLIPTEEIRSILKDLTPEQIMVVATMTYNTWEEDEKNRHIWFPYTARNQKIKQMIQYVEELTGEDAIFEYPQLPREFTGRGIDKGFNNS